MTDRLTKQQLKEDYLLTHTAEAADFVTKHGRVLVGAVVAVVVAAAVVLFVRTGSTRAEDRAAGMLVEARLDYQRGALDAAAARLEDIARNLGGTGSGKAGLLLYGDVRYAQGRYQDAEDYYRRAADAFKSDPLLKAAAHRGQAACLENLSRFAEAATIYRELAGNAPNGVVRADLRMALARNVLKAGNQAEAVGIYEELSHDPENPRAAQDARLRLAEIRSVRAG